jgi:hypothetical protein
VGSEAVVETGLDFAILGIGATGAIFENAKLQQLFPDNGNAAVAGTFLMAVNLVLSALVIVARKNVYGTR